MKVKEKLLKDTYVLSNELSDAGCYDIQKIMAYASELDSARLNVSGISIQLYYRDWQIEQLQARIKELELRTKDTQKQNKIIHVVLDPRSVGVSTACTIENGEITHAGIIFQTYDGSSDDSERIADGDIIFTVKSSNASSLKQLQMTVKTAIELLNPNSNASTSILKYKPKATT